MAKWCCSGGDIAVSVSVHQLKEEISALSVSRNRFSWPPKSLTDTMFFSTEKWVGKAIKL